MLFRSFTPAIAACALLPLPAPAMAQVGCALCFDSGRQAAGERPLTIEITTDLAFSRLALGAQGDGSASIDPQTGARAVAGGMVDLGGVTVQGRGRITGTPGRAVRIDLPPRITMNAETGATAELTDLTTDLPAWPVLDGNGTLEFSFGGHMRVRGQVGGNFRGRIPISVDYN